MTPEEIKILSDSLANAASEHSGVLYSLIGLAVGVVPILANYIRKAFAKEVNKMTLSIVNPLTELIETSNKRQEEMMTALTVIVEELKYLHDKADEHDKRLKKLEVIRSRGKKQVA